MPLRIVQSKQNARLKQLRRALAHPLSESNREGRALAGIEGPNLLDEALRACLQIDCVFVAQGSERLLDGLRLAPDVEVLVMPRGLLIPVLTTEAPQPIAALVEPPAWQWELLLGNNKKTAPLIVVLAGLQDPGNLGTILRSTEAFGATGVVSLPGTVSAWNPKAVRASAGSIFRVPMVSVSDEQCLTRLRESGVRILTTAVQGAVPAELMDLAGPVALLIGNEGDGVPEDLATQAGGAVTIPCPGAVESLNASVAASVLLYEASRQRTAFHLSQRARRMGHPDPVGGGKQ
jgi:TrmH family RNA methyltransferase